MYQIKFVKTVVGWFNVYLVGTERVVNLSPDKFRAIFPNVSDKTRLGCMAITRNQAALLGFTSAQSTSNRMKVIA